MVLRLDTIVEPFLLAIFSYKDYLRQIYWLKLRLSESLVPERRRS